MDPYIQQWSQSEDAQQYLQQAMQNLGMSQQGGMGGYGVQDPYVRQINGLIKANSANPGLQEWLVKSLVDYQGAMSQQNQQGVDENKLAFAQTLLSAGAGTPEYDMGMALAQEIYPQLANTGYATTGQSTGGYEDIIRERALEQLEEKDALNRRQYDWNSFLANASDEQIRQYEEAKKNATFLKGGRDYWGGTGIYNPFDASFWRKERAAQAKMGYF